MRQRGWILRNTLTRPMCLLFRLALCVVVVVSPALAGQFNIQAPAGSVNFGQGVYVLPNGNIVITDPNYTPDSSHRAIGAVYLYKPDGTLTLVLMGSAPSDSVGSFGVTVLKNGNFVVRSPHYHSAAGALSVGAVTLVDGSTGQTLDGMDVPSSANSLVGSTQGDSVGLYVDALDNGNYVVRSPGWTNGTSANAGAVTLGNGTAGVTGPVSVTNSLVGTTANDRVGFQILTFPSGNFVVYSENWTNTAASSAGAATFVSGTAGKTGPVSPSNSLVGSSSNDQVASEVFLLPDGYVVQSPHWGGNVGAATFGSNVTGVKGAVSAGNSLVGTTPGDAVGSAGVVPIANATPPLGPVSGAQTTTGTQYLVLSPNWNNNAGAVTLCNGSFGPFGQVSTSNSLYGTMTGSGTGDYVGGGGAIMLTNNRWAVLSSSFNNGAATLSGAVTFSDGITNVTGAVSASNSFVGTHANDEVGSGGVTALANGGAVIVSPGFTNGTSSAFGAVTIVSGAAGLTGSPSISNSIVGTGAGDNIGLFGAIALGSSRIAILSPLFNNGSAVQAGAITFASGVVGTTGSVSVANSLVGTMSNDSIGNSGSVAVGAGNLMVGSASWTGAATNTGAVTFAYTRGLTGAVSPLNSLVGTLANDHVGNYGITPMSDGNVVIRSASFNSGATAGAGAVTLASGSFRLAGTIQPWNSVIGTTANGGTQQVWDYDPTRHQLVVGRPADNLVTLFTMDQIFADGLEP